MLSDCCQALGLIDSCQASPRDHAGNRGDVGSQGGSRLYLGVGAVRGLGLGEQPGPGGAPGGETISESVPDPAGRWAVSGDPQILPPTPEMHPETGTSKCPKPPQNAAQEHPEMPETPHNNSNYNPEEPKCCFRRSQRFSKYHH